MLLVFTCGMERDAARDSPRVSISPGPGVPRGDCESPGERARARPTTILPIHEVRAAHIKLRHMRHGRARRGATERAAELPRRRCARDSLIRMRERSWRRCHWVSSGREPALTHCIGEICAARTLQSGVTPGGTFVHRDGSSGAGPERVDGSCRSWGSPSADVH